MINCLLIITFKLINFKINNLDSSVYASEGQIKIICIAIKLPLKKLITDITNREPILLSDDVFATLDKTRISSLTEYVINCKQAFITTTSILEIPDEILKNALVLRIENKEDIVVFGLLGVKRELIEWYTITEVVSE